MSHIFLQYGAETALLVVSFLVLSNIFFIKRIISQIDTMAAITAEFKNKINLLEHEIIDVAELSAKLSLISKDVLVVRKDIEMTLFRLNHLDCVKNADLKSNICN